METGDDPFGFIIESCYISSSQEEILRNRPFVGEPEELYEDESLDPGGHAVNSTGVFMASPPESNPVALNGSHTPQETYHTPPEESAPPSSASGEDTVVVHWGSKDSERAVDLGRDGELRYAARKVSAGSGRVETVKTRALKKPSMWGENEGSREFSAQGPKVLEIKLPVGTLDAFAGILKEEIKEILMKATDSLMHYESTCRGDIRDPEELSIKRKLNLSVVVDGAPRIVDLRVEGYDSVPEDGNSTKKGKDFLADMAKFRYKRGRDFSSNDQEKAVAPRRTSGIGNGDKRRAQAGFDREGQRSGVESIKSFEGDSGPKEADRDNGESVTNAGVNGAVVAQTDCFRRLIENIDKLMLNGGKDPGTHDKGKAVAECEGIEGGGEKRKAQVRDDQEARTSAAINIQNDKDPVGLNEFRVDHERSVTDVEATFVAQPCRRREIENVEKIEKFRCGMVKDPSLLNEGKANAENEEIRGCSGERPKAQASRVGEGPRSVDINPGSESTQNVAVNGNKFCESSNADHALRRLPSCVQQVAHSLQEGVFPEASAHPLVAESLNLVTVLKEMIETRESRHLEKASILDFAKKRGMTFPRLNSQS